MSINVNIQQLWLELNPPWLAMRPNNTSPYPAHQASLPGASYTDSSDDESPLRPATTPAIVGSSECMESGAGQSIETRNIRPLYNTSNYVDQSKPLNEAPILAACRNNQIDLLQDLLAAEPALAYRAAPSDITDKVRVYLYPLGVTAQEGHEKAVEQLLIALDRLPEGKRPGGGSIMAVINTADPSGRTPLHLAACRGHIKVVEQLLNALDRLPETERPAAVQRLLSATDDGGQTPLQLARQQNHQEVAVLLRDALQKPAQTARLDSIIPEDFDQPGASKLPAAQPGTSNEASEVSAQRSLSFDTLKPRATYVEPLLSYDEIKTAIMHLHRAAKNGNIEILERLLSTTPDFLINMNYIDGETPLCAAARYGHPECVKALLGVSGILVNAKDIYGWTPLCAAARYGHAESVKALLRAPGILVNEKTRISIPRAHAAIGLKAHVEICRAYRRPSNILVNEENNYGSPLCAAASFDVIEGLEGLLTGNDDLTPLHLAAGYGHAECVKALLTDPGILVNDNNNRYGLTPLHYAAKSGHQACLRLLIASKNMKITLLDAARDGQTTVLEEILKNLKTLKGPAKSEAIMLVLNVVDQGGKNLLCRAAQAGHEKVVALLLNVLNDLLKPEATRAVLSAADSFGRTPLHIAAHHGHYKIVTQLLAEDVETGFSYTCVASKGQEQLAELLKAFPILSAAMNGKTTIVARMLKILETWPESERCQAVTTVMTLSNKYGQTALHVAAQIGEQKVVEQLLNTLDGMTEPERAHTIQKVFHASYVRTPLHWAAFKGYHKIVGQLLDAVGRLPATAMRKAFTAVVDAFDQKVVEQFLSTANNYQESEQQIVAFEAMIGAVRFKSSRLAAAVGYQLIKAFPLLSAVLGGHNQSVKQLMQVLTVLPREERGAAIMVPLMETRADGATPLYLAASQGNIEIMKPLLSAVTILLNDGKRKEAREVLYSACTVKEEDGTLMEIAPLGIAAINRHDKAVSLLLEKIRELFIT
ncbi:ankyrin repeat domain-containing protein [Thalassotalea sp. G20_0]|uniref:ankyrin repeat domain-containing protein n=1 Tax=Thalassotalea sp. G20_0 TaxID=2821093 RepID=UPI001ADD4346|nr:ankyrin repeat domain-containing protein [Thalassotalea sp. G20_0]MBO9496572.1 ankyrin repeat domain-containing protein [Thalassotalea sp. G20_0]